MGLGVQGFGVEGLGLRPLGLGVRTVNMRMEE